MVRTTGFLEGVDAQTLLQALDGEQEVFVGVVLAHTPRVVAAQVLASLDPADRQGITDIMKKGRSLPEEAAGKVAARLRRALGTGPSLMGEGPLTGGDPDSRSTGRQPAARPDLGPPPPDARPWAVPFFYPIFSNCAKLILSV